MPIPSLAILPPDLLSTVIYASGLTGALWLMWPRLSYFFEYRILTSIVKAVTGHMTLRPRSLQVGSNLNGAYDCVKRALASRQMDQRWAVRQIRFDEPIERAIRLEGTSMVAETPAEENERVKSGRAKHNTSLRIQVDITETKQGTSVHWKFLPEDDRVFNQKLQVLDQGTSLLLARTNFNIIRELGLAG